MNRSKLDTLFLSYRASGDATALAQVFDLAAPELYELARRLAPDRGAAEDVLQDTFVAAIEKRASWDDREPLLPWLIGILAIASQRRRRERARTPDPERLAHAPVERPDEALAAGELRRDLEATLAALKPEERSLVEQRLLEGRTPRDMARERGLPATTLRMRLSRALARLRRSAPSSLTWALLPWGSTGKALLNVRLRLLPGVPSAATALAPIVLAGSLLGIAAIAGAIGIVACLKPEKQKQVAAAQPPAPLEPPAGSQPAAQLEAAPVAKGAEAAGGASIPAERSAVPKPPPVFKIGTAPAPGEFDAPADPPETPRKHLHLAIRRLGVPVAHARVLREFGDAGYHGSSANEEGRIDLEFVEMPEIQLCFQAPSCKTQRLRLVPAEVRDGAEMNVDLEPGPQPVRVRLTSATGFPEGWCVRFVPLALLGDRRPGLMELLFQMPKVGHDPECQVRSVKPDGTVEPAVDPGKYWVVLHNGRGMVNPSKPTLTESRFELTVPEVSDFDVQVETQLGGVILLDVVGQAGAGPRIQISLVEGKKERVLMFQLSKLASGGGYSSNVPIGTQGAVSETLPPGEHEIVIRLGREELERRLVTIEGNGELKLSIKP